MALGNEGQCSLRLLLFRGQRRPSTVSSIGALPKCLQAGDSSDPTLCIPGSCKQFFCPPPVCGFLHNPGVLQNVFMASLGPLSAPPRQRMS